MVAQSNAAIARLRELPKAELIAKAARATSALSNMRRQVSESQVPNALKGSASSIAGGALAGALRARAPEVMGVPSEGAAGLLMLGLGVGIGSPMLIHAGTGCLTVLVADFVQDQLSE